MGRLIRFCVHFFLMSIIFVLLLLCIVLTTMQTTWAKRNISEWIVGELQKKGIEATIEGLEGKLPFSWKIDQMKLHFPSDATVDLKNITLRSAFFPLLRKHLVIDYFHAEIAEYAFFQSTETSLSLEVSWDNFQDWLQENIKQFTPPVIPLVHLSVHRLKIAHVHTHNLTTDKQLTFSLEAKGNWKKNNSAFSLLCKIASEDKTRTEIELSLDGSRAHQKIHAALKAHIGAVENLPLSTPLPFEGEALINLQLNGHWQTWEALVWNTPFFHEPLDGKIKAKLKNITVPQLPAALLANGKERISGLEEFFNRDWLFASDFHFYADQIFLIEKLQLYSDLFHLQAKGELDSDLKESKMIITYSLPDLSLLTPWIDTPLFGSMIGKGYYDKGMIKTTLSAAHVNVNHYPLHTVHALLIGEENNSQWEGRFKLNAEQGTIPFESSFLFTWEPNHFLDLSDILLNAHETSVTGNLCIDLPDLLLEGSLYSNVAHLSQFSPFFPHARIDGSFGAETIFSLENRLQNVRLYFLSKNLRYNDHLIDDMSLSANIVDLYHAPQGRVEILAEKIFTPEVYFNQIFLSTQSNGENWPFYLNVNGSAQGPCDLNARGSWKKEDDTVFFQIDRAEGEMVEQHILLDAPFEIEWGDSHLIFSPSEWEIGPGSLSTSFSLSPEKSLADLDMEHFPLQVLSLFKPKFSIEGSITGRGFFEATDENIRGAFNVVLEEGDIFHYGKKKPWRTKGSLQAHLDHSMLQIHTDLHAMGNQFLDFSASIPLAYTLYPFQIGIDDLHPLSGELIAEGEVQDIFDFVNIGTHHLTGLLSCRLFLSQTYAHPSVQGEIEWQNGTYENYYTGTVLNEIQAKIEALNREIHLVWLTACDEEKGELEAEGILQLKPESHYPYEITSDLANLHLLRFDTIDCYLTGPLYITGTTKSALAEGNLNVSYATIHIPDHLPYDLPKLPVTFVNRPPYLNDEQISSSSIFPLHIDLELTAEQDVHVEGKGLSSEWEGSVRLTGTNTTVAANGSLSLLSGEYLFSGKVFKLTDGQITFNDKPTPSAYLNLSGELGLSDMEVTAQLRGPLTSPQLTFQSNPHMPTSSVLARILFNKDISDISHPEALQLANTLMSLSGGAGPDVLEAIRKSIGVDRLTIVPAKAGSDQIAVQIGKYLTKGVLITLSQSATSSQVIVEVELKKGFIFQAETQEDEEGKFSLKWRKSY